MEYKLKPCPFCGQEVGIVKQEFLPNGFTTYRVYHGGLPCVIEDAYLYTSSNIHEVIKKWNRRADDTDAQNISWMELP